MSLVQIKLRSIVAGPDYRGQPGEVIEVSADAAKILIDNGAALSVETAAVVPAESAEANPASEAAVISAPETAAKPGKPVRPPKAAK